MKEDLIRYSEYQSSALIAPHLLPISHWYTPHHHMFMYIINIVLLLFVFINKYVNK